ncbi:hypothetical protein L596_008388 [Steinernema carpocapsae]|uniref:Mitochondrial import inner membrane translocase subunit n=1 Tax=Steinernema carpocapsae TaxID=34508 RepID=A0A4U5PCU5_STECR|nr:hypothetical protein L596_008388 [Steinernema carpocapsae]
MESLLDMENLKNLSPDQQAKVLEGVRQQTAIANAQTLITDLSEKCTAKCITSPGTSLTSSDQQCLSRCMDRFVDTFEHVTKVLQGRLHEEFAKAGHGHGHPSFQ